MFLYIWTGKACSTTPDCLQFQTTKQKLLMEYVRIGRWMLSMQQYNHVVHQMHKSCNKIGTSNSSNPWLYTTYCKAICPHQHHHNTHVVHLLQYKHKGIPQMHVLPSASRYTATQVLSTSCQYMVQLYHQVWRVYNYLFISFGAVCACAL